jgi:PAS domain S-box-containing protein
VSSALIDATHLLSQLDASVALFQPVLSETNNVVDARITWVNRRAELVWGECTEVLASTVCPDFDEWLAAANAAWRSGPVRRLIEADHGRRGWTRAISTVSRVEDHLSEVTVDRSADQELIERLAVLDRQYRSMLAALPVTLLASRVDRDELDFVSPNAVELTGRPLHEVMRRSSWRSFTNPEDHVMLDEIVRALSAGEVGEGVGRIVRPDGTERRVEARAQLTEPGADGIGRFLITMLDVTDHYEAQRKAEQSERLETLARTAGSFAHEFSSLLQIIGGNLERLQGSPGVAMKPLEQSLAAVARAGTLVNGLMSFASSRPGVAGAVSVPELCRYVSAALRAQLPEAVTVEIELRDDLPKVTVAADALRLVMLQIVENAADAMPNGGVVRIEVCEAPMATCHMAHEVDQRRWVCVSVTDNGVGIEPTRLRRVWEPFHTSRRGVEARGSGLGLSMVHGVVHQFGGHVALDSCTDRGTTVTVYLPAADA